MRKTELPQIPKEIADVAPPRQRRGEAIRADQDDPPPPPPPSAKGRFVELDCRQGQAHMVIEVEGAKQVFLIEDPGKIVIKSGGRGTVDLNCGPQKEPVVVQVEYIQSSQPAIQGVVRTLAFE